MSYCAGCTVWYFLFKYPQAFFSPSKASNGVIIYQICSIRQFNVNNKLFCEQRLEIG